MSNTVNLVTAEGLVMIGASSLWLPKLQHYSEQEMNKMQYMKPSLSSGVIPGSNHEVTRGDFVRKVTLENTDLWINEVRDISRGMIIRYFQFSGNQTGIMFVVSQGLVHY